MPTHTSALGRFGWRSEDQLALDELLAQEPSLANATPMRVSALYSELAEVIGPPGKRLAHFTGRLRLSAIQGDDPIAVGDWVLVVPHEPDTGIVLTRLRRTSVLERPGPLRESRRIIAANVDQLWIATSAVGDLNPRRLERYIAVANAGSIPATVIITKVDLLADQDEIRECLDLADRAADDVLLTSSVDNTGLAELESRLAPGQTIALTGSSGVGKSTLCNRVLGLDLQSTSDVRSSDGRGRHTTTTRQLFDLGPERGFLIDTPGLRELGVMGSSDALAGAFRDISALGANCRYRDCTHDSEPGCEVLAALDDGELAADRLRSWRKLQREAARQRQRENKRERIRAHKERIRRTRQIRHPKRY